VGPGETYVVQTMMREDIDEKDGLPGQQRIMTIKSGEVQNANLFSWIESKYGLTPSILYKLNKRLLEAHFSADAGSYFALRNDFRMTSLLR
jgi:hypothetical protein